MSAPEDMSREDIARLEEMARLDADFVHIAERLITAQRAGTFQPMPAPALEPGMRIVVGQPIGTLVQTGVPHEVSSAFNGVLMGLLALPGERVRKDQPLAWMVAD
jgi:biotin carboxyl carrier protein